MGAPKKTKTPTASAGTTNQDAAATAVGSGKGQMLGATLNNQDSTNGTTQEEKQDETTISGAKYKEKDHAWCLYTFDNSYRDVEIIDSREMKSEGAGIYMYYVHYMDFNRRMDAWVHQNKLFDTNPDDPDATLKRSLEEAKLDESAGNLLVKKTRGVVEFVEEEYGENAEMDEASIREHEAVTKIKNINNLVLGPHVIPTWYYSPIPREFFPDGIADTLYVSEFTLDFFRNKQELARHYRKCKIRHPPGDEIYRDEKAKVAFFEVDGAISKVYCQNLCYLAKFFLDHKTLHYDVDPFLFYVLCEFDERGYHLVGYFSKEKYSESGFNLACILSLPPYQRKGYGKFIISFSYELSKKERKVGSPEKPLSDLGQISYRSYWSRVLLEVLRDIDKPQISIMDLTKITSIKTEDVIQTLTHLKLLQYVNGKHVLRLSQGRIDELLKGVKTKGPKVNPDNLFWAPLIVDVKRDKWSIKSKRKDATGGSADGDTPTSQGA